MQLLRAIWFHLRALFNRAEVNSEFSDELQFHIERETEANVARGMTLEAARRAALASFGGVERFKENLRDERSGRWMADALTDVRYGFRLLRSNRLFSSTVIGTLALGIGATSTIFAIVNGVLLRPLPYVNADRIVAISEVSKGRDQSSAAQSAINAWRESSRTTSSIASYTSTSGVLTGAGEPLNIEGGQATAAFFTILGVQPELGRTLVAAEEQVGSPRVIMLSHALWQKSFGGDPAIINRTMMLSGVERIIIGVMPRQFDLPAKAMFWVPLRATITPGHDYFFQPLARLRDGVTIEMAKRELQSILTRVDSTRPVGQRGSVVVAKTLHDRLFGSTRRPLTLLLAAVGILLLIACANVANLSLARAASRRREFAVRLALGASRWRLMRQLLIESSLLACIGGAIGVMAPMFFVGMFVRLSPKSVAGVSDIRVDGAVLLFTALITLAAALLFGLAPALTGSRSGPFGALASGNARSSSSRSHNFVRSVLVVSEVAAALTLLTAATLITKSFARALAVNPGFNAEHVYSAYLQLPRGRYGDAANVRTFYNAMADRVRALPGVELVSVSSSLPLLGYSYSRTMKRFVDDATPVQIAFGGIDSQYSRTVGLHLVKGRFIDETDVVGAPLAAMLTVSAARVLYPEGNAVGSRIFADVIGDTEERAVVVGIVDDVSQISVDEKPMPQIFLASAQNDSWPSQLIVRTSLDSRVYQEALKGIITSIDPLQPLTEFRSLRDELSKSVAPRRFNSILINAFAGLALLLAMIGLYGLMAHAVITRTRELGIRMALGAKPANVLRLVLKQGFGLTLLGVAVGMALSWSLSRTLSSLLYEVPVHDPVTTVLAPALLSFVAFFACYIPARRATRVNPMIALRQD